MIQLAKKERNRRRTESAWTGTQLPRLAMRVPLGGAYVSTSERGGHPESNWASFRELRHVHKCGRARTRTPISGETRRESARWNEGRRRRRTAGRGFETASRIYRTSGLAPRPDLLVSAREFLHAAADAQPRTCATPTSRFLTACSCLRVHTSFRLQASYRKSSFLWIRMQK